MEKVMKDKALIKKIVGAVLSIILSAIAVGFTRKLFYTYIEIAIWCLIGVLCITFSLSIYKKINFLYKISILCVYFGIIILIGFVAISQTGILQNILEAEDGKALYETLHSQFGNNLYIILIIFQFLQVTFIPIASSIVTAAGYYLCGQNILLTILFCCIGLWAGSLFAFFLGRTFGVKLVKWIAGEKVLLKYNGFVKGKDKVMLGYMFLFPVYPDDILCLIAGLTAMSWREFIFIQLLSRPINVAVTVLMVHFGTSLTKIFPLNSVLGIIFWCVIVILFILSFVLVWKKADKLEAFMSKIISKITGRPIINDINTIYKLTISKEESTNTDNSIQDIEDNILQNEIVASISDEKEQTEDLPQNIIDESNKEIETPEQKEIRELKQAEEIIENALNIESKILF